MKDIAPTRVQKIEDSILKNWNKIVGIFALMLIGGLGYSGWNYMSEQKELEAQADLFKAEQTYNKTVEGAQKKSEGEKPDPVNLAELDFTQSIEQYNQVLQKYNSTTAAVLAAHKISEVYIEKKKYEEAITPLKSVKPKEAILFALTNIKLGGIYEKLGKCEESLNFYNPLTADKKYEFVKPEVLLKTALCYEKMDQVDKAKETYQKISTEYAGTPTAQEAEKYLKLLTLNKG